MNRRHRLLLTLANLSLVFSASTLFFAWRKAADMGQGEVIAIPGLIIGLCFLALSALLYIQSWLAKAIKGTVVGRSREPVGAKTDTLLNETGGGATVGSWRLEALKPESYEYHLAIRDQHGHVTWIKVKDTTYANYQTGDQYPQRG